MKRSLVLSILAACIWMAGLAGLSAQSKNGICFLPEDKEHEECIDFSQVWYYAVPFSTGWVIHLREMNSKALPYIWDKGQYLISNEEWEKVKKALAGQGLSVVCPHPAYRLERDRLKSREVMCKKK